MRRSLLTLGTTTAIGLVLGFVLVVPVILGVAMSLAGDHLRGHRSLAGFVVSIVVLVSMVAVGWLLRVVLKPRKGKHSRQSG